MKRASIVIATTAIATSAEPQGYGKAATAAYEPPTYGNYEPPASAYGPPSGQYGEYAPYPEMEYNPHGHYEDFIPPVVPELDEPYPFTKFAVDQKDELTLPTLGDHHCFLTGAPWTQCGRRSLTSYFLDQCMVFHQVMTKNVQGICYVPQPEPVYEADKLNEYGKNEQPTEPAHDVYSGTGYGGALSDDYLKEKCLQKAFVSITAATVMCLTENTIRIKYIEHYAKHAASNPIEGPILYLKKLHTFIDNVLSCTGDAAKTNYPNLWKTFLNDDGHVAYNPNAPFTINSDGNVAYDRTTSNKATGLESSTFNDKFACSNTNALVEGEGEYVYNTLPHNRHYSSERYSTCSVSSAMSAIGAKDIRKCAATDEDRFLVDMTLRNLYDSVHYVEASITNARRPQTIAELAVHSAGVLEQPILEGFGIMYFCAFYACKANNGGDMDGTCLPEFNAELDWEKKPDSGDYAVIKADSEKIEHCLTHKWLTSQDISENSDVQKFNELLRRSYICMAESEVVSFLDEMIEGWNGDDDAIVWVYARHLADERCYEDSKSQCASNSELYDALMTALSSLTETCGTVHDEYLKKKKDISAYYHQYGGASGKGYVPATTSETQYGAPAGGYQAGSAPKYGPSA